MSKLNLSIGIPAYNEEANIESLIKGLLNQKQDNFNLLEIIICSDGSTDSTVRIARSIVDSRIRVIDNSDRQGQSYRQNQIFDSIAEGSDIVVLINADVLPGNDEFLKEMVAPYYQNELGIVGCLGDPAKPTSFFEKVLFWSVSVKDEVEIAYNQQDNAYLCRGSARAFSRNLVRVLRWPHITGEDVFSYIKARELGFKFYFQPNARLSYKLPNNFKDYFKQSSRYQNSGNVMSQHFSKDTIRDAFALPVPSIILVAFKHALLHPILATAYMFTLVASAILAKFYKHTSPTWDISKSSKSL